MIYSKRQENKVNWQSILVGLLLIPVNTYWIAMTEMVWTSLHRLGSAFLFGGIFFTFFLAIMRRKFIWWPFHPAGYAIAFSIDDFWFTILISSIIKWLVLRQGGARLYRRSIPFFLGLVIGEYMVACGWALLGVIVGKPMYVVWT
ncbi:hypothetical protein FJZ33_09735 [Candidatus Poribacteria bacterium]|nr:hypothetical protein [Candidatus Poribacteria bacterium]